MKRIKSIAIFSIIIVVSAVCEAKTIVVNTLSEGGFVDSEVSTNIAFNVGRSDLKQLSIRLDSTRSDANSVQIAFGNDLNGNGDLEPEESVFVVGRRKCNYFVEDVVAGTRYVETGNGSATMDGYLEVTVLTGMSYEPKNIMIECECGQCFCDMSAKPWMYRTDWNLVKVTRRGVAASEWCRIKSVYRAMIWMLR